MNRALVLLSVLGFAFSLMFTHYESERAAGGITQRLFAQAKERVFLVKSPYYPVSGTGFIVESPSSAKRILITAAHVCESHYVGAMVVEYEKQEYPVRMLGMDPRRGLCALEAPLIGKEYKSISIEEQQGGETAYIFGHPFRWPLTLMMGVYLGKAVTTAPAFPGNSGGPVVDWLGRVTGVVMAARTEAPHISFVLPGKELVNFLKDY